MNNDPSIFLLVLLCLAAYLAEVGLYTVQGALQERAASVELTAR